VDFFGITTEAMQEAMQEPLDKVRTGRHHPRSIRIRVLIPASDEPSTLFAGSKTRKGNQPHGHAPTAP
jgi:hypothetical protein